ncbi:hypothetical protein [Halotia branconii]|uniref:Uncharacterized protein n=1 Tax=Halotia branconii CENA392 TaxID=1539056 RepID=A0AAJ6NNF4_9CYAN|nr:hypothetical protein [Halotia branconii]WGV23690.1 hypothetical protein QI031_17955 [Halotia branconii CENA392]
MTQPIGYWTNYTPGDGSYLETLQERYGSRFEEMTKREKLSLIVALASHLCCTAPEECRSEILALGSEIPEKLSVSDQADFSRYLLD